MIDDWTFVSISVSDFIIVAGVEIVANDDDYTNTPFMPGEVTPSIFNNDTLNGSLFNPEDVTLSVIDDGGLTGVTFNDDGTVNIPSDASPGTYVLVYEICDVDNPDVCDTAVVTLLIVGTLVNTGSNVYMVFVATVFALFALSPITMKLYQRLY